MVQYITINIIIIIIIDQSIMALSPYYDISIYLYLQT